MIHIDILSILQLKMEQVGYVNSDSEYYDCGTIDEYWKLIKFLT